MGVTVSALYSYPVKSCAGIPYERSCAVGAAGIEQDREWVVVDQQGVFMTQRKWPRMALIRVQPVSNGLLFSAPGSEDFVLDTQQSTVADQQVFVKIWASSCVGRDEGDGIAQWLSQFLGTPCRLLRRHHYADRHPDAQLLHTWQSTYGKLDAEHTFGFADSLPFLITNEASLLELNAEIAAQGDQAVSMARFRPNIVVSGLPAYAEDSVRGIQIGEVYFAILKSCTRCPLPNVDPLTAQVGAQPLRALLASRRFSNRVLFGVQAVLARPAQAQLHLGQTVQVDYA